jgi:hypothetical protein
VYVAARNFAFAAGVVVAEVGAFASGVSVNCVVTELPAASKTVIVLLPESVAAPATE